MALIDVRDEDDRLLLRYDPETRIIEVVERHYDNAIRKHVKKCRRVLILPSGAVEVLPLPAPLPMAIALKNKVA